ncbi:MAG: GAF domain-containing protein, partial [Gemmatimonadales bacterium]
DADGGVLFLLNEETGETRAQTEIGEPLGPALDMVRGLAAGADSAEGAMLVRGLEQDELSRVRSLLAAPMRTEERTLGTLVLWAGRPDAFSRRWARAMSTVAGYKAVIIGADTLGKLFPLLITAAGTLSPAHVLVIGAGVAGLQAIATAHRLGAVVEAFDVRPAVKEQVESLGAKFVEAEEHEVGGGETEGGYAEELSEDEQEAERRLLAEHVAKSDVVITTALIPGKPAPLIITADMVRGMRHGSTIIDLAAVAGGNCELTEPGESVERHGVMIHGATNLPAQVPVHASQMYSRNLQALLNHLISEEGVQIDLDDEITGAICVTHAGDVRYGA